MVAAVNYRIESDAMGEMRIPTEALWGAQTQRAILNFPISGIRIPVGVIHALGWIKWAYGTVHGMVGEIDEAIGSAVCRAALDVACGELDDHFPLDVFQTGSGTSTNMNVNEVIAKRANDYLGSGHATRPPIHPNDVVNRGQSSNDAFPAAIHIAAVCAIRDHLCPALEGMLAELNRKQDQFRKVVKSGRTHLQDAAPVTLGQVFSGYATQIEKGLKRLDRAIDVLNELPLGGTAVGTGLNRHPDLPGRAIELINSRLHTQFRETENTMEANASRDSLVEAAGALRTIAVSLVKIGDDIRWLASGPRDGLGEIRIPAVQPGSSIMPGKTNPVILESLLMVCTHVLAGDLALVMSGLGSRFELNMMMPLMAHHFLQSITLLATAIKNTTDRCLVGIEADTARCRTGVSRNLTLATALAPVIGYDRATRISKKAYETGLSIREIAEQETDLAPAELDRLLDPMNMTGVPWEGSP
ncbi:class II fumarate hydratase [bacterium]|nr:class II fumarate hydratase [candidate division CSSED10-310 bacterium]